MPKRTRILAVGTALPDKVLTNHDLEEMVETSDEWIVKRTGIRERRICSYETMMSNSGASELGARASTVAIERAGLSVDDIDGIICATFTPDNFFPSTACSISRLLGRDNVLAFDLSAACAGFVYGCTVANALITTGQCRTILLVGSEIISKSLDWSDRTTCILFGDGAGAVVLQGTDDEERGIIGTHVSSTGSLGDILTLPAWGQKRYMSMNGNEVYKHAVRMMSDATLKCLESCGLSCDDIDLIIPHQANRRIITALARQLGVPIERVVINIERYGNTSSASIPLALDDAWKDGRIREGCRVLFTSLGGGITIGSAMVRF
ncbi:MAG: beta-ketoacyl-ACP synthase III [Chitinivibrionales bacterium]|nr:beta-ketoacyl-ACP synthase III [Chitinivibrionales bacterium]MBD3359006.1 beta-ketoacyl-ACP synthase III [Chitinivibrionales bacterium]